MESLSVLVSICCITFNHEDFIRDAIEGFLMQKTNFTFEIIIHDDASTDKTPEIIRSFAAKYPGLIIPLFQEENQYSKGIKPLQNYVFPIARGKYIALCEGDDYWTDPFKLQKQVDFLESNNNYSLSVGGYKALFQETGKYSDIILDVPGVIKSDAGFTFGLDEIRKFWITKTLTALFRKDAFNIFDLSKYKYGRDINLFYHLLKNGNNGFYFSEIFGVYRIHKMGINSMNQGLINSIAAYYCYKELYYFNKDDFSRGKSLTSTLNLLNFSIFNTNKKTRLFGKFKLYFEAINLVKSFREIKMLFSVFFPVTLKERVKEIFN